MWSKEIFEDETMIFRSIEPYQGEQVAGDIFLFGTNQISDPRKLHLAVYTGLPNNSDPLLIHANIMDKRIATWPLSRFERIPRYEKLHKIKRLQPHLFEQYVDRHNHLTNDLLASL